MRNIEAESREVREVESNKTTGMTIYGWFLLPIRLTRRRQLNPGHSEIVANLSCKMILDFAMSRNCRGLSVNRVAIDCMLCAFAHEKTSVRFYVPDEVGAFH